MELNICCLSICLVHIFPFIFSALRSNEYIWNPIYKEFIIYCNKLAKFELDMLNNLYKPVQDADLGKSC
jgi:hypothetical protein